MVMHAALMCSSQHGGGRKRSTMEEALADAPVVHGQPVVVAQADIRDGRITGRVEILCAASAGGFGSVLAAPLSVRCAPLSGQKPQKVLQ